MAQSTCSPKYHAGILKELTCPVCHEFMLPPIRQCQSGHNICGDCRPKLQSCPTCRRDILEVRNISMETLARETDFPCRNLKSGCNQHVEFSELKKHQAECSFGNYRCPFAKISKENCDWCGRLSDMIKHIKEAHEANTVTLNAEGCVQFQLKIPQPQNNVSSVQLAAFGISAPQTSSFGKGCAVPQPQNNVSSVQLAAFGIPPSQTLSFGTGCAVSQPQKHVSPVSQSSSTPFQCFLSHAILGHEQLFYVVFNITDNKLNCVVLHVGARNEALKFKYRLSLSSKKEDVTYSLITASFMDDIDNIFQNENCVAISAFSRFKKNNKLLPNIEILKYEEEEGEEEVIEEESNKDVKELTCV